MIDWVRRIKNLYSFKLYWAITYFISAITVYISMYAFASVVAIPIGIAISAVSLKIYVKIQKYKSIIKKKKRKIWQKTIVSKS